MQLNITEEQPDGSEVQKTVDIQPLIQVSHAGQVVLMVLPNGALWVTPEMDTNEAGRRFIDALNGTIVHTQSSELHSALRHAQEDNARLLEQVQTLKRVNKALVERLTAEQSKKVPAMRD